MKVHCRWCGEPLSVQPLRWVALRGVVRCFDVRRCAWRVRVAWDLESPPPAVEYESEPEDAWVCSQCGGRGEHPTAQDWQSGAFRIEPCQLCETTGVQPGYRQPAS